MDDEMKNSFEKTRESLLALLDAICDYHENENGKYAGMDIKRVLATQLNDAREALSLPPRNCDVGTVEEQTKRYEKFCESHPYANGCGSRCGTCPLNVEFCSLAWGQMPFKADDCEKTEEEV